MSAVTGLSPAAALAALEVIDVAVDAIVRTAPAAVERLGGREAMLRRCQMTCIGPVPRLEAWEWSALAEEHAAARSKYGTPLGGGAAGPKPRPGHPPGRGDGFGVGP